MTPTKIEGAEKPCWSSLLQMGVCRASRKSWQTPFLSFLPSFTPSHSPKESEEPTTWPVQSKNSELTQKLRERLKAISLSRYGETFNEAESGACWHGAITDFLTGDCKICTSRSWLLPLPKLQADLPMVSGWVARDIDRVQDVANHLDMSIPSVSELAAELRQAENEFRPTPLRTARISSWPLPPNPSHSATYIWASFEIPAAAFQVETIQAARTKRIGSWLWIPIRVQRRLSYAPACARRKSLYRRGWACHTIRPGPGPGVRFLSLVKSVLSQYNSASPYVPLANWDSGTCYDCGCSFGSGASYTCPDCEND